MATIEPEMFHAVAAQFLTSRRRPLSAAERVELLRIAQALECRDSARASGVAYETIKARRKRMYRKLGFASSNELVSALLGTSLRMLASAAGAMIVAADAPSGSARCDPYP